MKKLLLIIAVAGIVGLTSCSKEYVCTKTVNGIKYSQTFSTSEVTTCIDDNCQTFSSSDADEKATNDDVESYKNELEDDGYTCK